MMDFITDIKIGGSLAEIYAGICGAAMHDYLDPTNPCGGNAEHYTIYDPFMI